ncbi:flagellin [Thioclava sp. GXIMD4216]|uniref:flagellin N-terminal helical domain-containing protein n=1 Tax=Thioclava sp. GXIMD4216 TaxID=3131929 RepID=UPI0030CD3229
MSSILTNNGAMVALQTLKSINSSLNDTQSAISTGKDINSAKDNASVWAISKVMESDVAGYNAIEDSLSLGESTVAVASTGAEQIVEKLKEIKEKVVSATGENVDNDKISSEVEELKSQITSIIGASQFNGANLLDSSTVTTGTSATNGITVLSSLDRDNTGKVTASNISVSAADFTDKFTTSGITVGTATGVTLANIDVTTSAKADESLAMIEAFIDTATAEAAKLGASSARITDQKDFISKLSDSVTSGIGSLVDADMEETSARLQALQVQQQLGTQALSIANQAPQQLLSLFR